MYRTANGVQTELTTDRTTNRTTDRQTESIKLS